MNESVEPGEAGEGVMELRDEFATASSSGAGGGRLRKLLQAWSKVVAGQGDQAESPGASLTQELKSLFSLLRQEFGWEDADTTVLKRGMVELEDGEMVELVVDGADEEDELGEYAPVIVQDEE